MLFYTDIRVYHIDLSTGTMKFLTTVTREGHCWDFQAKGDLLIIGGVQDHKYSLTVRKISPASQESESSAQLTLYLAPDMVSLCLPFRKEPSRLTSLLKSEPRSSISILCSHMIIISTPLDAYIYRLPPLPSKAEGEPATSLFLSPITTTRNQAFRDVLCEHHDGSVSAYAFTLDGEDSLCILPPPGQVAGKTIWHPLHGSCARNASRAILCRDHVDLKPIEFQCVPHFTRCADHIGYARLGRARSPDLSQVATISLPGWNGQIADISWCEETARICVLCDPLEDEDSSEFFRKLIFIDLL